MSTTLLGRLLIVDDEGAHVEVLCNTLGTEGYVTTGFDSPKQALEAFRPAEFDLVLTDLMMPELDGITLLHELRRIDSALGGIVMTGHATIDTAVKAMQIGALDYIVKPFRLNALLAALARGLEVRRLRVENAALQFRERQYIRELESANKQLEAFSFSVSHDLRGPLATVIGLCEASLTDHGAGIDEEGRRLLELAVSSARRMSQLIEDLLQFCRFSRQPLARERAALEPIVRRALAQVQLNHDGREVELRIGELPACDADPSLMEQVFVNLLSNAYKFTHTRHPAVIEIGALPGEHSPVIYVRDNGAGFDMSYAGKLFGVFQRLHAKNEFEGTGIGLSIVQQIIARHGGRIWGEGEPGKGATFYFTLPDSEGAVGAVDCLGVETERLVGSA